MNLGFIEQAQASRSSAGWPRSLVRFSLDIWVIDVFPSCGTMGCRFWLAATLPILVFLRIIHWVPGQNYIIPPDNPVIGIVGNGAVLPCQVQGKIILEKLSVQWIFAGNSTEREVATFDGKIPRNQFLEFEGYQGRTEFFPQEFHQGNLSLLLKNVRPSDKGKYICVVFLGNWYDEVMVDLDVAVQGAEPSIFLDGHSGNGIDLSCRSQGWFPAPSVVWLDSQGRTRTEKVTTQSTPGPSSGVFDVVSSMSLEPGSDREVSCRVVSEVLNVTRESRVRIADSFFLSPSPWMIVSLIILSVDLGILVAVVYKMKRSFTETRKAARSRTEAEAEKEHLNAKLEHCLANSEMRRINNDRAMVEKRNKLDFWEARSHAVHMVLDPEERLMKLLLEMDPFSIPLMMARDALGAGKHYWEVKLGRQWRWALGVLWDRSSPLNLLSWDSWDFWALSSFWGELFSSGGGGHALLKQRRGLSVLGVFLDSEEERLEFYDVEQMDLVARMSLGAGKDPTGKFFPFVSRGRIRIRPVLIPVPLSMPMWGPSELGKIL